MITIFTSLFPDVWQANISSMLTWQTNLGSWKIWENLCVVSGEQYTSNFTTSVHSKSKMMQWRMLLQPTGLFIGGDTWYPFRVAVGSRLCSTVPVGNIPFLLCLEHSLSDCITSSHVIWPTLIVPQIFGVIFSRTLFHFLLTMTMLQLSRSLEF